MKHPLPRSQKLYGGLGLLGLLLGLGLLYSCGGGGGGGVGGGGGGGVGS